MNPSSLRAFAAVSSPRTHPDGRAVRRSARLALVALGLVQSLVMSLVLSGALLLSACTSTPTAAPAASNASPKAMRPPPVKAGGGIARVETRSGPVLGYEQGGLWIFKGLPYAQARRFQAPQPAAAWTQPRSSRAPGAICPQGQGAGMDALVFVLQPRGGTPSEDCLNLNVWAPAPVAPAAPAAPGTSAVRLPVMVWLHGGAYSTGSSLDLQVMDGASLARGGVVVVSLNHRLNALGFLDLSMLGEAWQDSANAGLLDIVAALRWVQDNIAAFGGDPANVTLFGQSGGASKVADLMTMPMAAPLFHKAIAQSTFRGELLSRERSRRITERLLARLKLDPAQADTPQRLTALPYAELAAAGAAALAEVQREAEAAGERFPAPVGFGYGPMLDGRVLPWQPTDARAAALAARVPLLIGSTHHEFGGAARPAALRGANDAQIAAELTRRFGDRAAAVLAAHAEAHPGWPASDWLDTDVHYRRRAVALAERHARAGAPVWRYLFDWPSPVLDGFFKVGHGAELPFVFDNIHLAAEATGGGPEAYALAERVSAAWRAFARSGDPRAGVPEWSPFTLAGGETLVIGPEIRSRRQPDRAWLDATAPR